MQSYILTDDFFSCRHQAMFLLAMDRLLHKDIADESTQSESRERIKKVMVGYIFWLLMYGRECPLGDFDLLDWNGTWIPEGAAVSTSYSQSPAGNEERPAGSEKSADSPSAEGTFLRTPQESFSVFRNPPSPLVGGYPRNEDTISEGGSESERPLEPDTPRYEEQLRNCCYLIRILDEFRTQFPEYSFLIARVIKCRLKMTWNPIEMCKHGGSHLWPDRLNYTSQFPYPYAHFLDYSAADYGGYGGQSIHEYNITLQVLVWRTVKSMNRLLALVSGDEWTQWAAKQSLDEKAIRDRTLESFRDRGTVAVADSGFEPTDRLVFRIAGHERSLPLDQWNCDVVAPSFHEDFFMDEEGKYLPIWAATLRYCDSLKQVSKRMTASPWESFLCYQVSTEKSRRKTLREALEREASNVGLFANELVTYDSCCPSAMAFSLVTHLLDSDHMKLLHPQYQHTSAE